MGSVVEDVGEALFGSEPEVKQYDTLLPEQKRLISKWSKFLTEQIGRGIEPYRGRRYAGTNPFYEAFFSALKRSPELTAQKEAIARALSGEPSYKTSPQLTKEIFEKRVKAPALQTWETELVPEIMEQFAGAGALSSSGLNRALAESARKLTTDLASTYGSMLEQERNLEARLAEAAANRALSAIPEAFRPLQQLVTGGELMRQLEQIPLQEAYEKWEMSQPWANPYLRALYGINLTTPVFETVMTGGSPGLMGSIIGAGGNILGSYLGAKTLSSSLEPLSLRLAELGLP